MEAAEKAAARRLRLAVMYLMMMQMPMTITDALSPLAIISMIIMYTFPYFVVLTLTDAKYVSKRRSTRWPKPQLSGAERAMAPRIVCGKPIGYHPEEAPYTLHIGMTITIGIIKYVYIDRRSMTQMMTLPMVVTIMMMVMVTYCGEMGPRRSRAADPAEIIFRINANTILPLRMPTLTGTRDIDKKAVMRLALMIDSGMQFDHHFRAFTTRLTMTGINWQTSRSNVMRPRIPQSMNMGTILITLTCYGMSGHCKVRPTRAP